MASGGLFSGLGGILDGFKGLQLHIVELTVDLHDLADVDILNDVSRFRIDGDGTARALSCHFLHRCDECIAIGISAGLFQRIIDQVHAVMTTNRDEAGPRSAFTNVRTKGTPANI